MKNELDLDLLMEAVRQGKAEITGHEVVPDPNNPYGLIVEFDIKWHEPIEYIQLNFVALKDGTIKFEDIVDDSETDLG